MNDDRANTCSADVNEPRTGDNEAEDVKLRPQLGLVDAVAMIVGSIVGSGIFISPKGVLESTGSAGASLIVWALCGLVSYLGAICYSELGTMITSSGGDYAYLNEAFGTLPAFLYLWAALFIIIPVGNAIIALAFANYVLQPIWGTCEPSELAAQLIAAFAIGILAFVNSYNVRWVAKLQNIFMAAKILALVLIIGTGAAYYLVHGEARGLSEPFEGTSKDPSKIAVSFYSGLFSYAGWNCLNFVAEEVKEPNKNLPRAIMLSMPIITVVYVLANVAYLVVLTPQEILASSAVAVTFGDHVFGAFTWVIQVLVALSALGTLHSFVFSSSRIFFVGARNGHLPSALALLSINHLTPVPAVVFITAATLGMLFIGDVYVLINYTSFVESSFIALTVCGMLWLRYKRPDVYRPIKVNLFFPIAFFFASIFLVCFPIYSTLNEVLIAAGILIAAIPVYFLCIAWQKRPQWLTSLSGGITHCCQKMFLAIPQSVQGLD